MNKYAMVLVLSRIAFYVTARDRNTTLTLAKSLLWYSTYRSILTGVIKLG